MKNVATTGKKRRPFASPAIPVTKLRMPSMIASKKLYRPEGTISRFRVATMQKISSRAITTHAVNSVFVILTVSISLLLSAMVTRFSPLMSMIGFAGLITSSEKANRAMVTRRAPAMTSRLFTLLSLRPSLAYGVEDFRELNEAAPKRQHQAERESGDREHPASIENLVQFSSAKCAQNDAETYVEANAGQASAGRQFSHQPALMPGVRDAKNNITTLPAIKVAGSGNCWRAA